MLDDKNQTKTSLSELGEFGLIEHIIKHTILSHQSTVKGVGDDSAVLGSSDKQTLITTDLLVEGVHFDLSYMPLKHLGYKSLITSDIADIKSSDFLILPGVGKFDRAMKNIRDLDLEEALKRKVKEDKIPLHT